MSPTSSNQIDRSNNLGHLLIHYTDVSMHHRTVMMGFAAVYFAITQLLVLTPPDGLRALLSPGSIYAVASAALLTLFILAAVLHHGCSFCLAAALKAAVLAEIHYLLLPATTLESDAFHRRFGIALNPELVFAKDKLNPSVFVILTFCLLFLANSWLFFSTVAPIIKNAGYKFVLVTGAGGVLSVALVLYYGFQFWGRYRYLLDCSKNLALVFQSNCSQEVDKAIHLERP
jgi:hypothetical protein